LKYFKTGVLNGEILVCLILLFYCFFCTSI